MLRTTALTLTLAALPMMAFATPEGWRPLLEPAQLAQILEREGEGAVRIIHVSGDFADGHIPGASFSPYAEWRGPPANPGALREVADYTREATRIGIDADTPTVVVHAGTNPSDMGTAARVYWTMKSLGVQDLALVNGGFAAWTEAGLPVSNEAATPVTSDFQPDWNDRWYIDTTEVTALVDSGEARLIDSRPSGFFEGIAWSIARPGTVRGAENIEFSDFFDGNRMRSNADIRQIAEANDLIDAPTVVSFCNTGHWAAINWFALSEIAGVEGTRLYAESMAEYASADRALDNAPGRITYLFRSASRWVEGLF